MVMHGLDGDMSNLLPTRTSTDVYIYKRAHTHDSGTYYSWLRETLEHVRQE